MQLGGPIARDKAFWWASVQRYSVNSDPAGLRTVRTEVSPRYNGKLTFNLTPNDSLIGSFQYDNYNQKGRPGYPGSTLSSDQQTLDQDSPEAVWNVQYRKVFSSSTFLEAKSPGYSGLLLHRPDRQVADPHRQRHRRVPRRRGVLLYADRDRNQANVSLSKYAEAFGTHNFKFGIEIERSTSHSRSEYMSCVIGPCYVIDYSGVPYYAYSGLNYNVNGKNRRESYYAQDAWKKGRLTVNLGLRLDRIRGNSVTRQGRLHAQARGRPARRRRVRPAGTGNTVVRGFWGRYYEGTSLSRVRQRGGRVRGLRVLLHGRAHVRSSSTGPTLIYRMAVEPEAVRPRRDQRQLRAADRGATPAHGDRDLARLQELPRIDAARREVDALRVHQPEAARRHVHLVQLGEPARGPHRAGLPDPEPDGYHLPGRQQQPHQRRATPYRKYSGAMFVPDQDAVHTTGRRSSPMSGPQTKGNINNAGRSGFGGAGWENPAQRDRQHRRVPDERPHARDQGHGGLHDPEDRHRVNAFIRSVSGTPYTPVPVVTVSSRTLNWFSSLRPKTSEPLGTYRFPTQNIVDLRVDKTFKVGGNRLHALDGRGNLFNASIVTGRPDALPEPHDLRQTSWFLRRPDHRHRSAADQLRRALELAHRRIALTHTCPAGCSPGRSCTPRAADLPFRLFPLFAGVTALVSIPSRLSPVPSARMLHCRDDPASPPPAGARRLARAGRLQAPQGRPARTRGRRRHAGGDRRPAAPRAGAALDTLARVRCRAGWRVTAAPWAARSSGSRRSHSTGASSACCSARSSDVLRRYDLLEPAEHAATPAMLSRGPAVRGRRSRHGTGALRTRRQRPAVGRAEPSPSPSGRCSRCAPGPSWPAPSTPCTSASTCTPGPGPTARSAAATPRLALLLRAASAGSRAAAARACWPFPEHACPHCEQRSARLPDVVREPGRRYRSSAATCAGATSRRSTRRRRTGPSCSTSTPSRRCRSTRPPSSAATCRRRGQGAGYSSCSCGSWPSRPTSAWARLLIQFSRWRVSQNRPAFDRAPSTTTATVWLSSGQPEQRREAVAGLADEARSCRRARRCSPVLSSSVGAVDGHRPPTRPERVLRRAHDARDQLVVRRVTR